VSDEPTHATVDGAAPQELLAVAAQAARAGATVLLARFGPRQAALRSKTTPTDPVSEADLAAESAIRAVLRARRPGDAILGEEGGETAAGAALRWVVDPLDGTVNFLFGIPQFAVSVACEDEHGSVAGVVLDPLRDECFSAIRGGPATLADAVVHASSHASVAGALIATGFGYEPGVRAAQGEVVARVLPVARDVRRAGAAALDLCWCACGRLDAYYERGVKRWDVAAGGLIAACAGLSVRQLPAVDGLPDGVVVAPAAMIDELYAMVC
jgi:myo-inositol-1(or 4)-monophosphatase